jgi:hypothetical protein
LNNVFYGQDDITGGLGDTYTFSNNYQLTITGNVSQIAPPVGTVPVPAAAWLFGSVLAGFGLLRRRDV